MVNTLRFIKNLRIQNLSFRHQLVLWLHIPKDFISPAYFQTSTLLKMDCIQDDNPSQRTGPHWVLPLSFKLISVTLQDDLIIVHQVQCCFSTSQISLLLNLFPHEIRKGITWICLLILNHVQLIRTCIQDFDHLCKYAYHTHASIFEVFHISHYYFLWKDYGKLYMKYTKKSSTPCNDPVECL